MTTATATKTRHSPIEDAAAVFQGTLFVALGLVLLKQAGLAIGGTAGVSFLLHYLTELPLGWLFFLVNVPFYLFAYLAFGTWYALKTFAAVTLLAVLTQWVPRWLIIQSLHPVFATVTGGLLAGMGLLILFRHRCSLGGLGVLAVYCQERLGWRAGTVQMIADALILLSALFVLHWNEVILSVLGAVCLNLVLAINHKPGRYAGM